MATDVAESHTADQICTHVLITTDDQRLVHLKKYLETYNKKPFDQPKTSLAEALAEILLHINPTFNRKIPSDATVKRNVSNSTIDEYQFSDDIFKLYRYLSFNRDEGSVHYGRWLFFQINQEPIEHPLATTYNIQHTGVVLTIESLDRNLYRYHLYYIEDQGLILETFDPIVGFDFYLSYKIDDIHIVLPHKQSYLKSKMKKRNDYYIHLNEYSINQNANIFRRMFNHRKIEDNYQFISYENNEKEIVPGKILNITSRVTVKGLMGIFSLDNREELNSVWVDEILGEILITSYFSEDKNKPFDPYAFMKPLPPKKPLDYYSAFRFAKIFQSGHLKEDERFISYPISHPDGQRRIAQIIQWDEYQMQLIEYRGNGKPFVFNRIILSSKLLDNITISRYAKEYFTQVDFNRYLFH